jgi:hypothetical protein
VYTVFDYNLSNVKTFIVCKTAMYRDANARASTLSVRPNIHAFLSTSQEVSSQGKSAGVCTNAHIVRNGQVSLQKFNEHDSRAARLPVHFTGQLAPGLLALACGWRVK